jgi:hypothetical protein
MSQPPCRWPLYGLPRLWGCLFTIAGNLARCAWARRGRHDATAITSTDLLVDLVHEGLPTATPETVHPGRRPIEVVRVRITDAGRLALDG